MVIMTSRNAVFHVILLITLATSRAEEIVWACAGTTFEELGIAPERPVDIILNAMPEGQPQGVDPLSRGVILEDTGRYNRTRLVLDDYGRFRNQTTEVLLAVVEPPRTVDGGELVMGSKKGGEGQGAVRLTCGKLFSLGYPPVSVMWKDPEGQILSSSGEINGVYFLDLLPSSPSGIYACYLPCEPLRCCLPLDSPLRHRVSLDVITAKADVTTTPCVTPEGGDVTLSDDALRGMAALVTAHVQQALLASEMKMEKLAQDLQERFQQATNHTDPCELSPEVSLRLDGLEKDVRSCQLQVATLEGRLEEMDNGAASPKSPTITFHARGLPGNTLEKHDHLNFTTVINNEGDAYNPNTGEFIVPVRGVYFFATSVQIAADSPEQLERRIHLYVDGVWKSQTSASRVEGRGEDFAVPGSCLFLETLNAGQVVYVGNYDEDTRYWGHGCSFSGMLVQALP